MRVQNQGREYFEAHAIKNHPMSFECDICGKVLDEQQNFKSHIKSVHEGKKN